MRGDEIGAALIRCNRNQMAPARQADTEGDQWPHITFRANGEYGDPHGLLPGQKSMPEKR
jgi:hypothetical protein